MLSVGEHGVDPLQIEEVEDGIPQVRAWGITGSAPQISLQVITEQGADLWLAASEVTGLGAPALVRVFLPFSAGDQVRVRSTGACGWEVTGRRLGVELVYRVHLAGTPVGDELEVVAEDLESLLQG